MNITRVIAGLMAGAVFLAPIGAQAQLGGLTKRVLGSSSGVSSADAQSFLTDAMRSTKNVMISAALLAQALDDRTGLAARKQQIDSITNAQDFGELDMHKSSLEQDLSTLSDRDDLAVDLRAAYTSADEKQKLVIATAVANLGLGVYRNVRLAESAPKMVEGIGRNPQLVTRVGEFKTAASLLGLQGKSLGKIGGALPKVLSALKIKPLPQSETTEPLPVEL